MTNDSRHSTSSQKRSTRGTLGEISGISPLSRGIASSWRSLAGLTRLGAAAIPKPPPIERGDNSYGGLPPRERFAREMERERLTSAEIQALARGSRVRGWVAGTIAIVALLYAVAHTLHVVFHGGGILSVMSISYVWIFALAIGAYSTKENLRAYQFRNRSLVSLGEWLGTRTPPGEQRKDSHGPRAVTFLWVFAAGGLAALMLPHLALAQAANGGQGVFSAGQSTTPMQNAIGILSRLGPSDLSRQWLARLFPSLTGGPSSTLASMFAAFNTIVLDIGGVFVFWQMALTMVHAAQNGSLRGSRVHVPYSAIRTFVGGAALAPVLGGFCVAQALALQIVGGGYWAADQLYSAMIGATLNSTAITQAVGQVPIHGAGSLIERTLSVETCVAWMQANNMDLKVVGVPAQSSPLYVSRFDPYTSSNFPWTNVAQNTSGGNYIVDAGECGALLLPKEEQSGANNVYDAQAARQFDASRVQAFQQYMSGLWSSGLPTSLASMISPNGGAKIGLPATSTPAAQTLTSEYSKVQTAAVTYLTTARSLVQQLAQADLSQAAAGSSSNGATASLPSSTNSYASAFSAVAQQDGWVSAGALYSRVAEMFTHSIGALQSSVPSMTMPQVSGMPRSDQKHVQAAYMLADQMMGSNLLPAASDSGATNGVSLPTAGSSFNADTAQQKILNAPAASLMLSLNRSLLIDPADPIGSIAADGSTMIYTGAGILTAVGVAKLASTLGIGGIAAKVGSVAGGKLAGAIGKVAGFFVTMGVILGEILIGLGSFETYVVPMMFYIVWMFAIVNVIAFAAEFVLAAPIAAFQHMRLFGEEAINQEQRQFYIISFLQGFLRPSLLLFGLAISTFVLSAIAQVLNATFNLAAAASLGNAVVGPIGIFVFVLMLMFLQFQLAIRSVELITRVPDAVADLVGGYLSRLGGESAGGLGERIFGSSNRHIGTTIGAAQSAFKGPPTGGAGGASGGGAGR